MAGKPKDRTYLIGQKFGRLTITSCAAGSKQRKPEVTAVCECGNTWKGCVYTLTHGITRSCGCLIVDFCRSKSTHGASSRGRQLPEYGIWAGVKNRCYSPNSTSYPRYGGRGVVMCERWRDSFENFLSDVGYRPHSDMSLDRIDNDQGYEPGNVRWASPITQANNKRNTKYIDINGVTKPISDWCRELDVPKTTVYSRLNRGWNAYDALLTPVRPLKMKD